jgi:hypothetical protein
MCVALARSAAIYMLDHGWHAGTLVALGPVNTAACRCWLLQAEAATCPGVAAQQTTLQHPTTSWHMCLMLSC